MNELRFRLGELFCGPGGLSLGAKLARLPSSSREPIIKHVWASDCDRNACETYARNIMEDESCLVDVDEFASPEFASAAAGKLPRTVICGNVEELCLTALQPIDAFAFGFPCNDYSVVGEQRGIDGKYGPLYEHGVKALNWFKPRWFIAENVSGLASAKNMDAFHRIVADLQDAGPGYELTVNRYHFEQYGVPQTRQRIIIVGIARAEGLRFRVPKPTTFLPEDWKTASQALADIPLDAPNHEIIELTPNVVARLKSTPAGKNAWHSDIPKEHQLNVKGAHLSQIYRRLDPDKPAYTVTGSGGGGTHGYHWEEPRSLSNRERARLQTFPDDYVFVGGRESVRRQVGMAVPPAGARVIIEAVLKTFAGIPYDFVEATWEVERGKSNTFLRRRSNGWQIEFDELDDAAERAAGFGPAG